MLQPPRIQGLIDRYRADVVIAVRTGAEMVKLHEHVRSSVALQQNAVLQRSTLVDHMALRWP